MTQPTADRTIPMPLIKVLLVEDDPEDALLTRAQVSEERDSRFHIEWDDNLHKAMNRLAKPGIDVVLLDLGLPELDGYKTHLAITSLVGKKPVVILTADESPVTRDLTKQMGAATYLVKCRTSPVELRRALWDAVVGPPSGPSA
jgi:DNA-binding response OmpR family regulator